VLVEQVVQLPIDHRTLVDVASGPHEHFSGRAVGEHEQPAGVDAPGALPD
jgi:hypothetical protein